MGAWMIGVGELKVEPKPDDNTLIEYIRFFEATNPYEKMDEYFGNPWFFDEDNNLQCIAEKFAEPSVWLEYVKLFFVERGFQIIGDIAIEGEDLDSFWEICDAQHKKYMVWNERKERLKKWYQK
ncbi:MAG: hypothetical protein ACI4CC_04205 [Lachnospiraceae bacterium]